MFERIVLTAPHQDLNAFTAVVERAARCGVTHVSISAPPVKSRWEIDDPADPYLQWSILHASLFKSVVPELLRDWVPADFAARTLETYRRRAELVKGMGLACAFLAYEPMWWPEPVFRANPHLRGARVDHPRRSRHPRFSPDVGHPQVQAMYRWAVAELARALPGLSLCIFSTNDSGVGLPWSERLYNSPNGPDGSARASIGGLVRDWFAACRAGATDAGADHVDFYIRGAFSEHENEDLARALAGDDGAARVAFFRSNTLASADAIQGLTAQYFYPVRELGQPLELLRGLRAVGATGRHGVIVNPMAEAYVTEWDGSGPELETLSRFLQTPPTSIADEQRLALGALADRFGERRADTLFDVYWLLDRAAEALGALWYGGSFLLNCVVAQRWITRPMVPFPERLSEQEKSYFRPHLFQALDEAAADNPLQFQGVQTLHGRSETEYIVAPLLQRARGHVSRAARIIRATQDTDLQPMDRRLRALDSLIATGEHFARFYTLLNWIKDLRRDPQSGAMTPPVEGSHRHYGDLETRSELYRLMRAEVDNTQRLIDLLREPGDPPLVMAQTAEHEDTFTLGPDLEQQLGRKTQIMWDHWLDLNELVARPNL